MNWQSEGNCVGVSTQEADRFHSENLIEQSIMTHEYCYDCPVRDLCLQSALDSKTIWGVWGGATQDDLRDALGLDENGRTDKARVQTTLCPRCREDDITATDRTRVGTMVVCNDCGIKWETKAQIGL